MIKLLRAGFFRLRKEIIFWLFIISSVVVAIFSLNHWQSSNETYVLDKIINNFTLYIGFFIALFVSIYVGKEYSEGIIRNKIIVGHSRASIYISKLIISIVVSLLCELIYVIIVLIVGKILDIKTHVTLQKMAMCIIDSILMIALYCSIFNFISMIFSDITLSTIINVIILVVSFIITFYLFNISNNPKYFESTITDADGNTTVISQNPNPFYPGDEKVGFAKTVECLIPFSQAQIIINVEEESLYKILIFSVIEICIINMGGIYIISKKQLK